MHRTADNQTDRIQFAENDDRRIALSAYNFLIEKHAPNLFDNPYHHHTSLEINLLEGCSMTYSFAGGRAVLPEGHLTIFWGASPHRVINLEGQGMITNIYLPLSQFTRWGLPDQMSHAILSGAVICTKEPDPLDVPLLARLHQERGNDSPLWRRMHITELEARLRRLAAEGWMTLLEQPHSNLDAQISPNDYSRVETMVRFVVENFTVGITVDEIATKANLSASRASQLFREVMGIGLKKHLTEIRLSHACMLLTETNAKVSTVSLDSGFASLSAFYRAFSEAFGSSPAEYREKANHRAS